MILVIQLAYTVLSLVSVMFQTCDKMRSIYVSKDNVNRVVFIGSDNYLMKVLSVRFNFNVLRIFGLFKYFNHAFNQGIPLSFRKKHNFLNSKDSINFLLYVQCVLIDSNYLCVWLMLFFIKYKTIRSLMFYYLWFRVDRFWYEIFVRNKK